MPEKTDDALGPDDTSHDFTANLECPIFIQGQGLWSQDRPIVKDQRELNYLEPMLFVLSHRAKGYAIPARNPMSKLNPSVESV